MSRRSKKKKYSVTDAMFRHTRPRLESHFRDSMSSNRLTERIGFIKINRDIEKGSSGFSSFTEEETEKRNELYRIKKMLSDRRSFPHKKRVTYSARDKKSKVDDIDRELKEMDELVEQAKSKVFRKKQNKLDDEEEDSFASKKNKKKRFRPVMIQIQDSVDKNLKQLSENPEKLRRLKKQIEKYEAQHTQFGKRVQKREFIKKNIRIARKYDEFRTTRREKFTQKRSEYRKWTQYNKNRINMSMIQETSKKQKSYEKRSRNAALQKTSLPHKLMDMEKKQKWSFIVSLISRVYLIYNTLEKKREYEYEQKRRRELTSIVFQKMMPIVRSQRHDEWVKVWIRFKKYWYFYRLWLHVAKKKRATFIIKTFLRSTGIDFSFVKKVNSFRSNIRRCQYYVKKFNDVKECREMLNIFRYTVVESRIILDRPLRKKKSRFIVSYNSRSGTSSSDYSSEPLTPTASTTNLVSTSSLNKEKKNEFFDSYVKPQNSGPVCQLRPSLTERKMMIQDCLRKRSEQFMIDYPHYCNQMMEYRERLQQQEFMEKAHRLLKIQDHSDSEEGLNIPPKIVTTKIFQNKLYDENGRIIPEPRKPFLSVFISEKEMEGMVRKGFKMIREKESKIFRDISSKPKFKDSLEKEKERYLKYDQHLMRSLKSYFEKFFDERRKLFAQATEAVNYIRKQRHYVHAFEIRMKKK